MPCCASKPAEAGNEDKGTHAAERHTGSRMKSAIRFSRASGSTRRLVEKLIARGWFPGAKTADLLKPKRRHAAGGHCE